MKKTTITNFTTIGKQMILRDLLKQFEGVVPNEESHFDDSNPVEVIVIR